MISCILPDISCLRLETVVVGWGVCVVAFVVICGGAISDVASVVFGDCGGGAFSDDVGSTCTDAVLFFLLVLQVAVSVSVLLKTENVVAFFGATEDGFVIVFALKLVPGGDGVLIVSANNGCVVVCSFITGGVCGRVFLFPFPGSLVDGPVVIFVFVRGGGSDVVIVRVVLVDIGGFTLKSDSMMSVYPLSVISN